MSTLPARQPALRRAGAPVRYSNTPQGRISPGRQGSERGGVEFPGCFQTRTCSNLGHASIKNLS